MPLSLPNPVSFEGVLVGAMAVSSRFPRGNPPNPGLSSAIRDPDRMEIHDLSRLLDDQDSDLPNFLEAHFNPKEVKETIKATWTEVPIPGMSHKRLHYHLTENVPFRFDLVFDTLQLVGGNTLRGSAEVDGTDMARRFLQSLCYPKVDAQSVQDGAPPRVLFYWPNFLSITCVVEQEEWTYQLFHTDGTPRRFTCSMSLKEIRSTRLSSSDVLRGGSKRNSPFPPQGQDEHVIKV